MTRKIALIVWMSLVPALALATPPLQVSVNYDFEKMALHISAMHPTDRPSRHYIRTINILKNGALVKTVGYPRQEKPSGIEQDISLDVQEGDTIAVELICNQGGSAKAETVIAGKPPEKIKAGMMDSK